MIAGQAAPTQLCFSTSTSYGGLLPADLDGSIAPPSGSPEYFVNFGTNGTESMVVNHSVSVGSKRSSYAAVRWYELRISNGTFNWHTRIHTIKFPSCQ